MKSVRNRRLIYVLIAGLAAGMAQGGEMTDNQGKLAGDLLAQVRETGLVRVIVTLQPSTPLLNGEPVPIGFCENVGCAKLALQNGLSEPGVLLIEDIEDLPLMVMEVTGEGLDQLIESPFVKRVEADSLAGITPDDSDAPLNADPNGSDLAAPQTEND